MRAWRQLCARAALPRWTTAPPCREPGDRKGRAGGGRTGTVFYHATSTETGTWEAKRAARRGSDRARDNGRPGAGGGDNPPPAAAGSACLAPGLLRCLKPSTRRARGAPAFVRKWDSPARGCFGEGATLGRLLGAAKGRRTSQARTDGRRGGGSEATGTLTVRGPLARRGNYPRSGGG